MATVSATARTADGTVRAARLGSARVLHALMWAAMLPCVLGASTALRLTAVALLVGLTGCVAVRVRRSGAGAAMLVDVTAMAVLAVAAELSHGAPTTGHGVGHGLGHGGGSIAVVLAIITAVAWAALRMSCVRPGGGVVSRATVAASIAATVAATLMIAVMTGSVVLAVH